MVETLVSRRGTETAPAVSVGARSVQASASRPGAPLLVQHPVRLALVDVVAGGLGLRDRLSRARRSHLPPPDPVAEPVRPRERRPARGGRRRPPPCLVLALLAQGRDLRGPGLVLRAQAPE